MTAPNLLDLEQPLRNLGSAILLLRAIAEGADVFIRERSLNWYADKMMEDYEAAKAWFDEAIEAQVEAKATGPRAVS